MRWAVWLSLALVGGTPGHPGARQPPQPCVPAGAPRVVWRMPAEFTELSGLALTRSGRLLVHGDELGRVGELDATTGAMLRPLILRGTPRDDFEGIAAVGDSIVLMTSSGRLYIARDRGDSRDLPYQVVETGLGRYCELEGLAWDPRGGVLLLPCKTGRVPALRSGLTIWRWSLAAGRVAEPARITIPGPALARALGLSAARATAIEVDPITGELMVLSSRPAALLRIDTTGQPVRVIRLDTRGHPQAEGLALGRAMIYIGDEGGRGPGTIAAYECRRLP